MGPPKISQTNNNMGPKLWKTQHPKLQFTYHLRTLPFYTSLHSPSQPLHILNYQKNLHFTKVFPQVSLRSTILHADVYTYPNTPTWQTHMVLISWKSQPAPLYWISQHPPNATQDPSTFTQQEQPPLSQWYILNKSGGVILLGYMALKRWLR